MQTNLKELRRARLFLQKRMTVEVPDGHIQISTTRSNSLEILDVFVTRNASLPTSIYCYSTLPADHNPVVVKVAFTPSTSLHGRVTIDFLHLFFPLEKSSIQTPKLQKNEVVGAAVSRHTEAIKSIIETASYFKHFLCKSPSIPDHTLL